MRDAHPDPFAEDFPDMVESTLDSLAIMTKFQPERDLGRAVLSIGRLDECVMVVDFETRQMTKLLANCPSIWRSYDEEANDTPNRVLHVQVNQLSMNSSILGSNAYQNLCYSSASTSTPRAQETETIKVSPTQIPSIRPPSPSAVKPVTWLNEPSTLYSLATRSNQSQPVLVKLPSTLKIGTILKIGSIPAYPPVTLQSRVTEKTDTVIKPQVHSTPADHGSSSVPSLHYSPETPDL
ncbi:hypothetical protein PCASD_09519 [Puccinia coronata f. sp. avenae]|uniref:Uncharacterized protein n=1 Tax=Puccinia coronata f. sp. avenae TaxID=200324 RepID=A0A2N5U656_9BASI|nr:hypothetical protein PCASD_09519 [Puccinia coronata f. sp. avenae]